MVLLVAVLLGAFVTTSSTQECPGYIASNVQQSSTGLTADLTLAGPACNVYGTDLPNLTLTVEYQTATQLHVIIQDQDQIVYQVPESVFPRPNGTSSAGSELTFTYTENPFTFAVARQSGEVLFNTSGSPMIFESQYLGLRTSLPQNPNLYGLGEHSDRFRLNTTNYTRTIWARDAYGIPAGTNLYGNHPVYVDHRGENGTHGVLLLNSNGMDIKINDTAGQYLEYNTLGGVFDFYFLAGPSPVEVAQQISGVLGLPAMDVYNVAEVVHNYSQAGIPLETMWTDIDYMKDRWVFTVDLERFPLPKVRELVDYLHSHQQHYIVMVDPAVAYQDYDAFNNGRDQDIFLKIENGSIYKGAVWPGVTAFPDWFHPGTQNYWSSEFASFFSADSGVDIDGLWIDMNEPANFCPYPCGDPANYSAENDLPPAAPPIRTGGNIELPGFPADLQPGSGSNMTKRQEATGSMLGLPGRDLINPPYTINNGAGSISNHSANTDLIHYNGVAEYDTHNLYGTMMSSASREAMLGRRPTVRPLVITRSTFLGAGAHVGHWTGDNNANWDNYHISIPDMLNFNSIFQVPMVGSDVCGFAGNTTETLCARWMMLGAFYPFYRNHNAIDAISQEAYLWPRVAAAARYAIDIRFRMLDYFYTAMYTQTITGKPSLNPMFYMYPTDSNTFAIDGQFFYGDAVMVSPVLVENSTTVDIYVPNNEIFYDWNDGFAPVRGAGANVTLSDVDFNTIPLHIRGGCILPLRAESANTTSELRKKPFQIVVALGLDGSASGSLYLDEGDLLEQPSTSMINFTYSNGTFALSGSYNYDAGVNVEVVTILGVTSAPNTVTVGGSQTTTFTYNETTQVLNINATIPLTGDASVQIGSGTIASYTGTASRDSIARSIWRLVGSVTAMMFLL